MREKIDKIFVYGTLMEAFSNDYAKLLREKASFLGKANIPGLLIDLGLYPGAVYDDKTNRIIHGEVYEFRGNKLILELDFYEGNWEKLKNPKEFVRIQIPVFCQNEWIQCWFYQYNQPYRHFSIIETGDYLEYLQGVPRR